MENDINEKLNLIKTLDKLEKEQIMMSRNKCSKYSKLKYDLKRKHNRKMAKKELQDLCLNRI